VSWCLVFFDVRCMFVRYPASFRIDGVTKIAAFSSDDDEEQTNRAHSTLVFEFSTVASVAYFSQLTPNP